MSHMIYDVIKILNEKGLRAGTILSADGISIVINTGGKLLEVKVPSQEKDAEKFAQAILEYYTSQN